MGLWCDLFVEDIKLIIALNIVFDCGIVDNKRGHSRGRQLKFGSFSFFLRALTYLLISTLDFLFLSFWPFGLSYFLIFSPTLLYIHNLFVPFTFLGNQRDIKYRSITFPPLAPAANIDMSPLLTFYFHSHSYLSLFLTRKKIFLLLSFSLISYLFLSFSTLFFLPLSFSSSDLTNVSSFVYVRKTSMILSTFL